MGNRELAIIGGSAGGMQAAICAQKHHGSIVRGGLSFDVKEMDPCGIPYIYGTLGTVEMNIMPDKLLRP